MDSRIRRRFDAATVALPAAWRRYAALLLLFDAPLSAGVPVRAQPGPPPAQTSRVTSRPASVARSRTTFASTDVLATVEGQRITRSELTYFWLQTDVNAVSALGALVADSWKATRGAAPTLQLRTEAIYRKLYGRGQQHYARVLWNLILNRVVAVKAARSGIVVTGTDARAYAHVLLDEVRSQRGLTLSDDRLLETFHIPRDVFMQDMLFRVRAEKLLEASIARRNGHPLRAEDWLVLRQLFAAANSGATPEATEQNFVEAKRRLQGWLVEIKGGKKLEEAASEHNQDATRASGGLRGPSLRGTGDPTLEAAILQLAPGALSEPLRAKNGWYVFRVEQRGAAIPEPDRKRAWRQVVEARLTDFLKELRATAKIKTDVPIPADPQQQSAPGPMPPGEMPPPPPGKQP